MSAWEAFDVIAIVLLVIALSAIALAVVTSFQRTPAIPLAMASIVTLLALVAVALVVYRMIDKPDVLVLVIAGGERRINSGLSLSGGVWVALVASAAMLAGCFLAIRDERPGAPAPPVEPEELPAPAP